MQFTYAAQDADKRIVEGMLEGTDRFGVARALRGEGLVPLSVHAHVERKFFGSFGKAFGRIKLQEKIVFTHNLAGMLTAGLSLYRALEVLKKQNKNPAFEKLLDGLLGTVNGGGALSDGLAKYPKIFSALFVSMVRAGEESGNLPGALAEIGSSLEKSYNLSRKVKGALMYPMVIISAIVIIGVLMLIFVVPTITKIFTDVGTALPATTQFVVLISSLASNHPLIFVGTIAAFFGGLYIFFTSKKTARITDKLALSFPGIGAIVKEVNAARTARTLSSLLASGVEMTRALEITRDVLQNVYYKEVLARAVDTVQRGDTLSSIFKSETKLYPIMLGEMTAVGEETGALTKMLADIATYYEEEVDAKTKNLSTIIEPILMLFIGAAVGFFAISMISPMYSLLNNI